MGLIIQIVLALLAMTVKPYEDPSTKGKRFVIGDRRMIVGFLTQPQNKYVTGGFAVTAKELGFDKTINSLKVDPDKAYVGDPIVERISDSEYKVKFFVPATAAQVANEAETMKELEFPFVAIGE